MTFRNCLSWDESEGIVAGGCGSCTISRLIYWLGTPCRPPATIPRFVKPLRLSWYQLPLLCIVLHHCALICLLCSFNCICECKHVWDCGCRYCLLLNVNPFLLCGMLIWSLPRPNWVDLWQLDWCYILQHQHCLIVWNLFSRVSYTTYGSINRYSKMFVFWSLVVVASLALPTTVILHQFSESMKPLSICSSSSSVSKFLWYWHFCILFLAGVTFCCDVCWTSLGVIGHSGHSKGLEATKHTWVCSWICHCIRLSSVDGICW